jgi:transposase-like protein
MSIVCPYCLSQNTSSETRDRIVGFGSFVRKSDNSRQRRFLCKPCGKSFSSATHLACFGQKKRHLNPQIFQLLASGTSQRRLALLLRTNRKTIVRKFIFLGLHAHHLFVQHREQCPPCSEVEFDDLETFEHTKLKPLSVTMMVESGGRRIIGFRVARMSAKGLLAKKALKKYGPRKDERWRQRERLFNEVKPFVALNALIKSDESPHYTEPVRRHFPNSVHRQYKGQRGCVTGQGELKAVGFDPLFSLNHSFAMLRANINRLFRRTWNTTKRPERLALHIAIYAVYHNLVLI